MRGGGEQKGCHHNFWLDLCPRTRRKRATITMYKWERSADTPAFKTTLLRFTGLVPQYIMAGVWEEDNLQEKAKGR